MSLQEVKNIYPTRKKNPQNIDIGLKNQKINRM